jgi:putative addiction module component (TIGR02574 family)
MTEPSKPIDYSHLSVAERILLAQELWESVHEYAQQNPLTDAERKEINRRWAAYQAAESKAAPWPEVKQRLQKP